MIPLSTRMRPEYLDDFVGQTHFMYKGSLLYNAIKNKTFDSAVFFGPSGTGKTTLARIAAREMNAGFVEINASVTGTKELKELIENAKNKFFGLQKQSTYLYVDEIHRWNKLQQDALLKALEDGVLRFIGSTTENPYFSINNAVLSRVGSIYEFKRLSNDEVLLIINKALNDNERGLGERNITFEIGAKEMIADMSCGDARIALDTLGFIAENINEDQEVTRALVGEAMQKRTTFYDKIEDKYNLLSALQKSVRGSDPDAAIHYLARLIKGGADEKTIGRRLLVMASEDVGLAYPSAITVVYSCVQAALTVGFPEAQINFAEAVILMASCPKSNRTTAALFAAQRDLAENNINDVPEHLMDAHYSGAKKLGRGIGYKYPHDYDGFVDQQYLPDDLYKKGVDYYKPTERGTEASFKKYLRSIGKKK